jgi:hypothetical protein
MHPFCSLPSCQPSPSPLSSAPGDLILEFAKALDSRQDILNLALTARSPTALSLLIEPNLPPAVKLYLFICITRAVRICISQHHSTMYIHPRHAPTPTGHLPPCQGVARPSAGKMEERPYGGREWRRVCGREVARGVQAARRPDKISMGCRRDAAE